MATLLIDKVNERIPALYENASEAEKQRKANELYLHFLTTGLGRISVQVMSEWRNAMVKKIQPSG